MVVGKARRGIARMPKTERKERTQLLEAEKVADGRLNKAGYQIKGNLNGFGWNAAVPFHTALYTNMP